MNTNRASDGTALLLAIFFGPLGLIYKRCYIDAIIWTLVQVTFIFGMNAYALSFLAWIAIIVHSAFAQPQTES